MMSKRAWIGGFVVLLLATVVVVSLTASRQGKGVRVYVEPVERRDLTERVKASGQIDPRVKVNISAHVIGKIERLHVREGDWIEAGTPFLELEKEAFIAARDQWEAQYRMAETEVRQAEVALRDAELKLQRARRLAQEGIASAEELESAELQKVSAELRLARAREAVRQAAASLDKARDDLAKATIYAPLSGRVIALHAKEGEVVVSGTMNNPASIIGVIADLSEILAEVEVDETEVVKVRTGQEVVVKVDALPDREYRGRVVEIGSSGFHRPQQPDVTYFKVKVLLEEPDRDLLPGMSVRAEIEIATRSRTLVVPLQAVVERLPLTSDGVSAETGGSDDEIKVVFVVEDEVVHQRRVETGISDATHVEILSGVEEGEKVVTGPYRSLKDLQHRDPVRISQEPTPDSTPSGGGETTEEES